MKKKLVVLAAVSGLGSASAALAVDLVVVKGSQSCQMPIATGGAVTVSPTTGDVSVPVSASASCPILGSGLPYSLVVTRSGGVAGDTVIGNAPSTINCGTACDEGFPTPATVTLQAVPASGSTFSYWLGACSGASPFCTVLVDGRKAVHAVFSASSGPTNFVLTVTKSGSGTGTVTSTPSGINCGSTCSSSFPASTVVTLSASANSGSTFVWWSGGGCSGTGSCSVNLSSNVTVNAAFSASSSSACSSVVAPAVVGTRVASTTVKVSPGYTPQSANAYFYSELFRLPVGSGGSPVTWPGNTQTRVIRIPKTGHIAAEFTVPASATYSWFGLSLGTHGDDYPTPPPMVTVHECPGNFNTSGPNAVDPRCVNPFLNQGWMNFAVVANAATYTGPYCPLEKGKTYYLNMAHYDPDQPSQPACWDNSANPQCGAFLNAGFN